jgi:hypothetical protein
MAERAALYEENGVFNIRIELSAKFEDDYEGDDDGYVWLEKWRAAVQPRLVRAVFEALRSDASFDAIPVSRGRAPDENLDVEVRFEASRRRPGGVST